MNNIDTPLWVVAVGILLTVGTILWYGYSFVERLF
jgi:hypothetical protein